MTRLETSLAAINRLTKNNTACRAVDRSASCFLSYEIHIRLVRNDAALEAEIEELFDGDSAVLSVVERTLVDVHADEAVGEGGVEIAGELHGVGESFVAVIERVLDAVTQRIGGGQQRLRAERAADGVASEREGRPVSSRHHWPRSRSLTRPSLA